MEQDGRVFVFGATGVMGRRVVSLLREGLAPERVIGVSRRSSVSADITAPQSVTLQPGDVVIDAVGPYLHHPGEIVRHCLTHGAHYVDLSESLGFHQRVAEAVAGYERSNPVRSAIVSGCSTVPAMVDVLLPARPGTTRIALLSVGTRNEASPSLLFGLLRPLGRKHEGQRWWHESTTRTLLDGRTRRYGSHPSPWPGDDAVFYCGLDYQVAYWVLRALSWLTRHMGDAALFKLCRAMTPLAKLFAIIGTPHGSLRLERRRGDRVDQLVEIRADADGLMIPALPAVWATAALLDGEGGIGVTRLFDLIDSAGVLERLRARGYSADIDSSCEPA